MRRIRRMRIGKRHQVRRVRGMRIGKRHQVRRVRGMRIGKRDLRSLGVMCVNLSCTGTGFQRKCCAR